MGIKDTKFWLDVSARAEAITLGQLVGVTADTAVLAATNPVLRKLLLAAYNKSGSRPAACGADQTPRPLMLARGTTVHERRDLRERLARGSNTVVRSSLGELYEIPLA
jgi:hypothetical protein